MNTKMLEDQIMHELRKMDAILMTSSFKFTKNRFKGTFFPYIPLDVTVPVKLFHLVEPFGFKLRRNIYLNLSPGKKWLS